MKAKEVFIGGKKYLLSTNNNWELSNKEISKPENQKELKALYPTLDLTNGGFTPAVIKLIQGLPRGPRSTKGKVQVKTDKGLIKIGMADLCAPGEVCNDTKGTSSKFTKEFWLAVKKVADGKLAKEFMDNINAELAAFETKQDLLDKNAALEKRLAELEKKLAGK